MHSGEGEMGSFDWHGPIGGYGLEREGCFLIDELI